MPSAPSTVVLARKYRPRRFADMVGQEQVVTALTNALQRQRLHHAYLFTGTRGIGKTTVSRILAKSLNCTGPDGQGGITPEPCGVCQACTEIDADRYLDYTELDAASNRSIDEVRDLIERAAYKPGIGRFKVFMIDEAHQLTKDAFNALLKTLEEPPDYLKFVLATTDPEKMLPTVLSRCLQFNLRPMPPPVVQAHLQTVLAAEGVACDDAALRLLSKAAHGSMRDGLSLTDQAIAYGGGQVDEATVRRMLGSVDRSHPQALVAALARRDGVALLEAVNGLRTLGLSAAGTLEAMAALLQQMAVEQAVPGTLDATDPDHADAVASAPLLEPDETQLLYSIVLHGRAELGLMDDEYGALTMVLLRLLAFPAAAVRAEVVAAPARPAEQPVRQAALRMSASSSAVARVTAPLPPLAPLARREVVPVQGSPAPAPAAPALPAVTTASTAQTAPAAPAVPAASALCDRWASLVERIAAPGGLSGLARELACQGGLHEADDAATPPRWVLMVERETLRTAPLRDKLAACIAADLGYPVALELQAGVPADSPARRDAAERARRQAHAQQLIDTDPVVLELLGQFKTARIVPGSVKPA